MSPAFFVHGSPTPGFQASWRSLWRPLSRRGEGFCEKSNLGVLGVIGMWPLDISLNIEIIESLEYSNIFKHSVTYQYYVNSGVRKTGVRYCILKGLLGSTSWKTKTPGGASARWPRARTPGPSSRCPNTKPGRRCAGPLPVMGEVEVTQNH